MFATNNFIGNQEACWLLCWELDLCLGFHGWGLGEYECFIMVLFGKDVQKYSGAFQSSECYWVAHKWPTHTCSYSSVLKHRKFLPVGSLLYKWDFLRLMQKGFLNSAVSHFDRWWLNLMCCDTNIFSQVLSFNESFILVYSLGWEGNIPFYLIQL